MFYTWVNFRCKLLGLVGQFSTQINMHTEIAEAIPGAHLVIMDNCSHLSPLEQAEQVTRELRSWLTGIRSTYELR